MKLQYIDMHEFHTTSAIYQQCPWLVRHPHGKLGWGYVVIDTDIIPYECAGYMDITKCKTTFSDTTKRIKEFYISKKYRGLGIGNKLIQMAVNRDAYIVSTSLDPDYEPDHANALHLYEKYGFVYKAKAYKNKKVTEGIVNLYRISLESN